MATPPKERAAQDAAGKLVRLTCAMLTVLLLLALAHFCLDLLPNKSDTIVYGAAAMFAFTLLYLTVPCCGCVAASRWEDYSSWHVRDLLACYSGCSMCCGACDCVLAVVGLNALIFWMGMRNSYLKDECRPTNVGKLPPGCPDFSAWQNLCQSVPAGNDCFDHYSAIWGVGVFFAFLALLLRVLMVCLQCAGGITGFALWKAVDALEKEAVSKSGTGGPTDYQLLPQQAKLPSDAHPAAVTAEYAVGSTVQVWSQSGNGWVIAQVASIDADGTLTVRYGINAKKIAPSEIHRTLRPIDTRQVTQDTPTLRNVHPNSLQQQNPV